MNENKNDIRKETTPKQSLFRFIDDIFCEQFVQEGKIRLGNITKYANSEGDIRGDATESVGMFQNEYGGASRSVVINEAVFILSCSQIESKFDIKKLFKKFKTNGHLYLEIFDPELLLQKIKKAQIIGEHKFLSLHSENFYWTDVEYTKGTLKKQHSIEYKNSHIFQKPREQISPQIISAYNGIIMQRPLGGAGVFVDDLLRPHWPDGSTPINYEEEHEFRLVLDGLYRMAVAHDGAYKLLDHNQDPSLQIVFIPDEEKEKYIDLDCGNLEDCVRIKNIKNIE